MARAGLSIGWKCLFANDFDGKKGEAYRKNWGANELLVDDIKNICPRDLPGVADLIWGSFPCQDLSLAGGGAGLKGDRSGTFWPFMAQVSALVAEDRSPSVIAVENVVGTLTSHGGKDFVAICNAFHSAGYAFGAFVADASLFVPQSRPRLFVIAVKRSALPSFARGGPSNMWHTPAIRKAYSALPSELQNSWIWWQMPTPPKRKSKFVDIVQDTPDGVSWHSAKETNALLAMMTDRNLAKVDAAKASGVRTVGGVYKRTRFHNGAKVQRAEVRFDEVSGCLRTPAGGSSRQLVLLVEGQCVKSRLISARETARLMGLPDSYKLPDNYNEAYHLTGDGVAVPVVRHIAKHVIEPALDKVRASEFAMS